ncbi:hypothetical protein [Sorangium sp. So ce131]|uniref:hypothetical protein n=1 Tax=Sorangium sp. So ce131 TaxID=3133282 RepID=UPI003F62FAD9
MKIFEHLKSTGALKKDKVDGDWIRQQKFTTLADLALHIAADPFAESGSHNSQSLEHCASHGLSGSSRPCASIKCRTKRIEELARFACMYSDRIHTYNYFAEYHYIQKHGRLNDSAPFRQRLYEDLHVLTVMKPLLTAGLIRPFTPINVHHSPTEHEADHVTKLIKRMRNRLARDYFENTKISISKRGNRYMIILDGPEDYFEHGRSGIERSSMPAPIAAAPRIAAQILAGKRVELSASMRKKLRMHTECADNLLRDTLLELLMAVLSDANMLTDIPRKADLIKFMTEDPVISRRDELMHRHFGSVVPFLSRLSIADLVQLRQTEGESFVAYRCALQDAMIQFSELPEPTARDAKLLYSDVIAPELQKVQQRASAAQNSFSRNIISRGAEAAVAAAISVGTYLALSTPLIAAGTVALGVTKMARDIVKAAEGRSIELQKVRSHKFYYLWRVKREAESRS